MDVKTIRYLASREDHDSRNANPHVSQIRLNHSETIERKEQGRLWAK